MAQPPLRLWDEAKTEDGRVYYYNTITRQTQWEKPADFMAPVDVRMLSFAFTVNWVFADTIRFPMRGQRPLIRKPVTSTGSTICFKRSPGRCQRS
jgi:hypothetical protein